MPDQIASIFQAAREGRLIIFAGAGISSAGVNRSPSWWQIYSAAAAALGKRFCEEFPDLAPLVDVSEALRPWSTQALADLIQLTFAGQDFLKNLRVVDVADPNDNHLSIAALAKAGHLRAVLTTNFDTLLERSAAVRDMAFTVLTPGGCQPFPDAGGVPLFKLHGTTVDPMRMIETSTHKNRDMDLALPKAWRPCLEGAELLVVGYSGADLAFGAVGAFFADFLSGGARRVYWLHLPGQPPDSSIASRVTLIEGELPGFLRNLAGALGLVLGDVEASGRDAMRALDEVMDAWSRELHIGKWAAASFMLSLGRAWGRSPGKLMPALLRLAEEQAEVPIAERRVIDLAVTSFLQSAAMVAAEFTRSDLAQRLLDSCISLYSVAVADAPRYGSRIDEMGGNFSTTYGKLGLVNLISGEREKAYASFHDSMRYAYAAGHAENFLLALGNILDHQFNFSEVIRCMPLAEAIVAIADRLGISPVAIEGRLRMAAYHLIRNEIWIARRLLAEARGRAETCNRPDAAIMADAMLAVCSLKAGKIREGLTMLATSLAPLGKKPFLSPALELPRMQLRAMGIPQPRPYAIDLSLDMVAGHAAAIEVELERAKRNCESAWGGMHCFVPETATSLGEEPRMFLAMLGLASFEGAEPAAIHFGLEFGERALGGCSPNEARWAAVNMLSHPALPPDKRARALHVYGAACALSGWPDLADASFSELLEDAARHLRPCPANVAMAGLWHSVQSDDVVSCEAWVRHLASAIAKLNDPTPLAAALLAQLASWGGQVETLAEAFRPLAGDRSSDDASPFQAPFRPFSGVTAPTNPQVAVLLTKAYAALDDDQVEAALMLLDEVDSLECSEHERGVRTGLRVLAVSCDCNPAELDRALDPERARLLGALDFTALACLETALCWYAGVNQDVELTKAVLGRRAFIADLAGDVRARTALQALTARRRCRAWPICFKVWE